MKKPGGSIGPDSARQSAYSKFPMKPPGFTLIGRPDGRNCTVPIH